MTKKTLMKEQLLRSAERYVKLAMNNLTADLPDLDADDFENAFDQKADELFVHFLFPNLDEYERSLLVALRHFRRGVTLGVHTRQEEFSSEGKADHERTLTESESSFVSLKDGIKKMGIEPKLTCVQRELLEEEFFTVCFQPF